MAGFENYGAETNEIELAIERKGVVLGIDWTDKVQVHALAREALNHVAADVKIDASQAIDHKLMAKLDLFGLAGLMLKTMGESAEIGVESHGGPAWKAFASALWAEAELRK